jgi:hypothetical protein
MSGYMSRGPTNGSVYVCNLPPGTDETMLAEYFGTIGLLKVRVLPGNLKPLPNSPWLFLGFTLFNSIP